MDLMVHVTVHETWTVISIGGELDLSTAPRLRGALLGHIATAGRGPGPVRIALDLRGVGFIDSIGLGVLIGARRRVGEAGGTLALVYDSPKLSAMFAAAGVAGLFTTVSSVDQL